MAIAVTCSCGYNFSVRDEHADGQVRCPQCKKAGPTPRALSSLAQASFTPFEKRVVAQLDYLDNLAMTISGRLGWILLLLGMLVAGEVLRYLAYSR